MAVPKRERPLRPTWRAIAGATGGENGAQVKRDWQIGKWLTEALLSRIGVMMTKEEAIKLYESKFWEGMEAQDIAMFQLWEEKLCMPFGVFHEAMEVALKRPVWRYEFGLDVDGLKRELLGLRPTPSAEEIFNLIPEEKRVLIRC